MKLLPQWQTIYANVSRFDPRVNFLKRFNKSYTQIASIIKSCPCYHQQFSETAGQSRMLSRMCAYLIWLDKAALCEYLFIMVGIILHMSSKQFFTLQVLAGSASDLQTHYAVI